MNFFEFFNVIAIFFIFSNFLLEEKGIWNIL